MPGMDGVEFLRHLAGRQTPAAVIVLSGQDRSILNTVVQLGRAHGLRVLGSVSKPFTLAPLKALLEDACAGADARSGTFQPLTPAAIRAGLNGNAVELAFQPKVSARGCQMTGVETFLRWRGGAGELKGPAAVITVAVQHGLMNQLNKYTFHRSEEQRVG